MRKVLFIAQNRLLQHGLFWASSFYIFLRLIVGQEPIFVIDVIYAGLFHLSLILAVYLNLYLLIPTLLRRTKYGWYLLTLLALIGSSTPLNQWIVDELGRLLFSGYYFISEFDFLEVSQFTLVYVLLSSLLKWSKAWFQLNEQEKALQQMEKEKLDLELQALKAQINPHFLFNSINNIYALALDQDQRTAALIMGLSNCLRYMLYECGADKVPLEKELNYLSEYIELQKMRLSRPECVQLELNGSLQHQQIAPLLFIPILENGFKHGLKELDESSFFHIKIEVEAEQVRFHAINSKELGIEEKKGNQSGLGLQNLRQRLTLLYPNQHQLKIIDGEMQFELLLKLKLI